MRWTLLGLLAAGCIESGLSSIGCPADQATVYYADDDDDGYGDPLAEPRVACEQPPGHVDNIGDCDDADAEIHPDAEEICDEVDNDCDDAVDELGADFWPDVDGDGFGDATSPISACEAPPDHVDNDRDCNDADADVSPAASERCDEVDHDCDGAASTERGVAIACDVLLVDALDYYGADLVQTAATEAGAAAVEQVDALPASLDAYQLVILYLHGIALSEAEVDMLAAYHRNGGTLVLTSEWSGFTPLAITNTSAVLTELSYDTTMLESAHDSSCAVWTATVEATHPLTAGITSLSYGFSGDLVPGGSAVGLFKGASNQWLVAEENGLVLVTDGQVFDPCPDEDTRGNMQFVRNLVTWSRP